MVIMKTPATLSRLKLPILLLFALTVSGCSWGFGHGEVEPPEMHRQFSRTVELQTAVIQGDLGRAREAGAWLATHELIQPFPPEFDPYREEILEQASLISRADQLERIADHTGRIAVACGRCHEATTGGPHFVVAGGPPRGTPQAQQMITHLWALDRMWEGLVGPSHASWKAGAEALREAWRADPSLIPTSSAMGAPKGPGAQLAGLAERALRAGAAEARGVVFGEVLATCRACHQAEAMMAER
jgi:cytochrome c553